MNRSRWNAGFLFVITIAGNFGALQENQHSLGNNSACTVRVPELFPSFVSTHVDFLSPAHGSKHPVGVPIPLNVAVAVLPSLPRDLSRRLLLCLEVDSEGGTCWPLATLQNLPALVFTGPGDHTVRGSLVLRGSNLRLDCHAPEHDMTRFSVFDGEGARFTQTSAAAAAVAMAATEGTGWTAAASVCSVSVAIRSPRNRTTVAACALSVELDISFGECPSRANETFDAFAELRTVDGGFLQSARLVVPPPQLRSAPLRLLLPGPAPGGALVVLTARVEQRVEQPAEGPGLPAAEAGFSATAAPVVLYLKRRHGGVECGPPSGGAAELEVDAWACARDGPPAADAAPVVVTAADEPYAPRLRNLVGSLHHWAGDGGWGGCATRIIVYDLGLAPATQAEVDSWAHVRRRPLPASLPPHVVGEAWLVAWKPWVVLEALKGHRAVLWVDANAELRFPLSSVAAALDADGHFFTTAGHLFPTDKVVRPATLAYFGLRASRLEGDTEGDAEGEGDIDIEVDVGEASSSSSSSSSFSTSSSSEPMQAGALEGRRLVPLAHASRVEFTSALMGFVRGAWAHTEVLLPMAECCLDRACIWPADAVGNENQRRDQSVLNAALARASLAWDPAAHSIGWGVQPGVPRPPLPRGEPRCWRDKRWWAWAGQGNAQPPADGGEFDGENYRVFSRREAEPKPYVAMLVRRG